MLAGLISEERLAMVVAPSSLVACGLIFYKRIMARFTVVVEHVYQVVVNRRGPPTPDEEIEMQEL